MTIRRVLERCKRILSGPPQESLGRLPHCHVCGAVVLLGLAHDCPGITPRQVREIVREELERERAREADKR